MTFFDQKEEVLEVELTQYGKYLLSRGKWKPAYYAFFDDDIIYDGKYAGVEENNADLVSRIKQTPRTKTQYVFTGIEEQVKKNLELVKTNKERIDSQKLLPKADKHYALTQPLGNSILGETKAPSITLNVLNGEIDSIVFFQTGDQPNLKIPLVTLQDYVYETKTQQLNVVNPITTSKQFKDGNVISVEEDILLLEIMEKNVSDLTHNFDIELFLVEEDDQGVENYTPLIFDEKFEEYKDGILVEKEKLSSEEIEQDDKKRKQNPFRAYNYFNISIDYEIDKNLICDLITRAPESVDSIYTSGFECEDKETPEQQKMKVMNLSEQTRGLYNPSVTDKDIKKC